MNALVLLVTAFCSCAICTGDWFGFPTSSGRWPEVRRTLACAAALQGAEVELDGIGARVCETVGDAIQGRHVDLYVARHEDAVAFGVREIRGRFTRLPRGVDIVDGRPVRVSMRGR